MGGDLGGVRGRRLGLVLTYLLEWNRDYAGRGIPKLLDTDLILRNMGRKGGSGNSAELKELRTAVATANSKVKAAEETSSSRCSSASRSSSRRPARRSS